MDILASLLACRHLLVDTHLTHKRLIRMSPKTPSPPYAEFAGLRKANHHKPKHYYYPERIYKEARRLQRRLKTATTYEEWQTTAERLDFVLPDHYAWKYDVSSPEFNYKLIRERLEEIVRADRNRDIGAMSRLLKSGFERNYAGIINPRLYERLYGGTKFIIEQYVERMVELLDIVAESDDPDAGWTVGRDYRLKMQEVDSARKAFGRTALVLQGGSLFPLFHLGVMRGLYKRELLPRIILGTGTGALWAALFAVLSDAEVDEFLDRYEVIVEAYKTRTAEVPRPNQTDWVDNLTGDKDPHWFDIFECRLRSFYSAGYVLDRDILEDIVDAAVDDLTFEEAYAKTGRLVSISIACDSPGTPNCLNYITTPNVLIRTAAFASNQTDMDKAPAMIREKNAFSNAIQRWDLDDETPAFRIRRRERERTAGRPQILERDNPGNRVAELWNVSHFIVSQAWPDILPSGRNRFNRADCPTTFPWTRLQLRRYNERTWELRKDQLRKILPSIFPLSATADDYLHQPHFPGATTMLKPEIGYAELENLFYNPTKETIDHWVLVGERAVWPAIPALHVRMDFELAVERIYQEVRRHPPHELLMGTTAEAEDFDDEEIWLAGRGQAEAGRGDHARGRSVSMQSHPV